MTPATPPTSATVAQQIYADLISLGVSAAAIFVKDPLHQQSASLIIQALTPLLADIGKLV